MNKTPRQRNRPAADDKLSGTAGAVWVVTEPAGRVTMWKCKPESVEEIHWATGISKTGHRKVPHETLATRSDT
jgi:hypothetical protein